MIKANVERDVPTCIKAVVLA